MSSLGKMADGREKVWVLEMNSSPLRLEKDEKAKKYKFKGLCAEFTDEVNENNRLYDKRNYDEKVSPLYDKISKRALCGELDHNEDFLVSMKNASHIVTGLKDLGKSYEIEIELIPGTTQGNNAIALAEAGVPLFISSRASGYIDKRGNVTLEKIYTYDLVSEPGFKNAELVPVNESINLNGDGMKLVQYKNRQVRVYKWTEPEHKGNTAKTDSTINKQNTGDMAYATKADLEAIRKEIQGIKNGGMRFINESLQVPNKLKLNGISVEMLNRVPQANDVLTVDATEFKVKKVENIDESKDDSPNFKLRGTYAYTLGLEGPDGASKIGYITKTGEFHIADEGISSLASVKESSGGKIDAKFLKVFEAFETKINELIDTVNSQKMEQKVSTQYIDGLAKLLEFTVNQHDQMVHFVNLLADHSDNSTKVLNKVIESQDNYVKHVHMITESLQATQQFVNEHSQHSDAVVKVVNQLIKHSDKSAKHLNMLHEHADQLTGMVNVHESKLNGKTRTIAPAKVENTASQAINESKNAGNATAQNGQTRLEQTKNLLTKVKSNKTAETTRSVLEAKYPFVKNFTDEELKAFNALPDRNKDYVLGKIGPNARKANVMEAISYAKKHNAELEFLDLMPKEKKAEWAMLPVARKQNIIALFQSKNLRTKTAIADFWENVSLKPSKTPGLIRRIDESAESKVLEQSGMGYSSDDMAAALGL